jgi:hypothetical protein
MEADTIFFQRSASKHLNPAVEVFCVLERSTGFAPVRTLSLPARPKQIPVHSFIAAMHFGGDVLGKNYLEGSIGGRMARQDHSPRGPYVLICHNNFRPLAPGIGDGDCACAKVAENTIAIAQMRRADCLCSFVGFDNFRWQTIRSIRAQLPSVHLADLLLGTSQSPARIFRLIRRGRGGGNLRRRLWLGPGLWVDCGIRGLFPAGRVRRRLWA